MRRRWSDLFEVDFVPIKHFSDFPLNLRKLHIILFRKFGGNIQMGVISITVNMKCIANYSYSS